MSDQQCSRLSWADPVGQAQQVFRLALTALSRPAQAHAFVPCPADTAGDELPAGLSPELAALACRRASREELARILALAEQVRQDILAGNNRTDSDQRFHQAIAAAAHNDFLSHLSPIINQAVAESLRLSEYEKSLAECTLQDHALLLAFLRDRDAAGAKRAMYLHLRRAMAILGLRKLD